MVGAYAENHHPQLAPLTITIDVLTRCNRSIVVVSMKVWVDHFSTYIYQNRCFYYFSRRVPKDVKPLHGKQRIVLALNTRSRAKALKHSQVICQRLDERWLPMRLDAMGLGNVLVDDVRQQTAPLLSEAVTQYLQLKGIGKAKTFNQAALRNAGVVIDQLGDRQLCDYSTIDAGFNFLC